MVPIERQQDPVKNMRNHSCAFTKRRPESSNMGLKLNAAATLTVDGGLSAKLQQTSSSPGSLMSARGKLLMQSPRVHMAKKDAKKAFPDMSCSHIKACTQQREVHPTQAFGRERALGDDTPAEFRELLELIGQKAAQKFRDASKAFRFVDGDHNGFVSRGEVRHFFRFFNMSKEQADTFFFQLSGGEDEDISYKTFVRLLWPYIVPGVDEPILPGAREDDDELEKMKVQKGSVYNQEKELRGALENIEHKLVTKFKCSRDAFRALDVNSDGRIGQEEIRSFFRMFGYYEDFSDKLYAVLDKDTSGGVDYGEFVQIFRVANGHPLGVAKRPPLINSGHKEI